MCIDAAVMRRLLCTLALLTSPVWGSEVDHPESQLSALLGPPKSVQVVASGGVVSDTVPILVPPGRKSVQPKLNLQYSSAAANGDFGRGWQLNLGFIERSRNEGTPSVAASNAFTYSFNGGGGTLVYANTQGTGSYRAKLENVYLEFRYTAASSSWQAFDGQGGVYTFNLAPLASPVNGPWVLSQAQDAAGNTVTYLYLPGLTHADGSIEPARISQIFYTGDASTNDIGQNVVQFTWEDRFGASANGTDRRLSYQHGVAEMRTQRVKTITIAVGSRTVRHYDFVYLQSPQTGESLLQNVVLRSADSSLSYTLRKNTYAKFTRGWNVPDQEGNGLAGVQLVVKDSTTNTPTDSGQRILDVTGDGYVDLIRLDSTNEFTASFAVGRGNTSFSDSSDEAFTWASAMNDVVYGQGDTAGTWFMTRDGDGHRVDGGLRLLDLNGDGLPDFVIIKASRNEVWLNNGAGWTLDDTYSAALAAMQQETQARGYTLQIADGSGNPTGVQFVDLNGDGRPDFVWDFDQNCLGVNDRQLMVRLNTGTTFVPSAQFETALRALPPVAWGFTFVFSSGGHCPGGTYYSKVGSNGVDFLDVNGDGLTDFVQTSTGSQQVLLNSGSATFVANAAFTNSLTSAKLADNSQALISTDGTTSFGLMPVDLNADGLPDYVRMVCTYSGSFCVGNAVAEAWLNTGLGWVRDATLSDQVNTMSNWQSGSFVNNQGGQGGAVFADLDADGLLDLILAPGGGQGGSAYFSGGGRATKSNPRRKVTQPLVHVETALGEVVDLDYSSSAWSHAGSTTDFNGPPPYRLPQSIPVCTQLTRSDGRHSISYLYSYAKGLFQNNQFYGFGLVKALVWSPPDGWSPQLLTRLLTYYQEDGLVGQIKSDSLANGLTEHTETWARVTDASSATPVTQLQLVATDEYLRDPGAAVKHKRVTQTYDHFLNRKTVTREADVGVDPTVVTTFTYTSPQQPFGFFSSISQVAVDGPDAHSLTRMVYDDRSFGAAPLKGLVTDVFDAISVAPVQANSTFVHKHVIFDHWGNAKSVTDAEGHTSSFLFDSTNTFVTQATDAAGNQVKSVVDPAYGVMLSQTDASGAVTRQSFDSFGRLLSQTLPGDALNAPTVTLSYSAPLSSPQPDAQWVEVQRHTISSTLRARSFVDGWAQAYRVVSGDSVVNLEYDELGNLVSQTLPAITYERDALRRPVSATAPDSRSQQFIYRGRTTLTTDPSGEVTRYVRDGSNNLIEIGKQTALGEQVTHYQFDSFGRLVKSVDANNATTSIAYDDLGRRVSMTEPNAGTSQYTFDANGRLVAQVRDDGRAASFRYGADGAFLQKQYSLGASAEFTFGAAGSSDFSAGRVSRVVDPAGTLELTYDVRGRVIERRRTIGDGLPGAGTTYVTGYGYDSLDRLTQLTTPDGFIAIYAYDANGRLASIVDREGHAVVQAFAYSALGQITSMQFGNGVTAAMTYDSALRLASKVVSTDAGVALQNLSYAYDVNGNVSSIDEAVTSEHSAYGYDSAGRLTHASGGWGEEAYVYDLAGNLTQKGSMGFALDPANSQQVLCAVDLVHPPSMSALAANPALMPCRDLVAQSGAASVAAGPIGSKAYALRYDQRGDVVDKGDLHFEYDDEGHVTRVTRGDEELERNIYDAAGQRVIHVSPDGIEISIDGVYEDRLAANRVQHHVFAGNALVATFETPRPVELITQANVTDSNGLPQNPVTGGGGGCATSQRSSQGCFILAALAVLALRRGRVERLMVTLLVSSMVLHTPHAFAQATPHDAPGRWYYYHPDHVGSVGLVTDDRADVVLRRQFKPYGDPVGAPETTQLRASFNGQQHDAASGLFYFGARHYDASMGRFLSPDTQVPDTRDPRSLLRYAFGADNPIRYIDPTGHNWLSALITVLVTIVIIAVAVAITIATGGVGGILLGALAGAAIGAGGGAAVGLLEGKSGKDLYYSIAVGAVLGALTGAAAGMSVADLGLSGAALTAFNIGKEVVVSAAVGALGEAIPDQVNGVDPRTMLVNCLISAGISVAFAGVGAAAGKALGAGLRALSSRLAGSAPELSASLAALTASKVGGQASKALDVIEFTVGVASGSFGGPATNIDSFAQDAADASLNAQSPLGYSSFVPPIAYTDASRDPRAALNFAPVTP